MGFVYNVVSVGLQVKKSFYLLRQMLYRTKRQADFKAGRCAEPQADRDTSEANSMFLHKFPAPLGTFVLSELWDIFRRGECFASPEKLQAGDLMASL